MKRKTLYIILSSAILLLTFFIGCQNPNTKDNKVIGKALAEAHNDLKEIIESNRLVVLAENSASSYFIYKGQKMGFEYEILNEFAKSIGVKLEVKIINSLDNVIDQLNDGEGDLIACNLTITKDRKNYINFSDPLTRTAQVLVQKKPEGWQEMSKKELESKLITDPVELSKKTIHVWSQSSYHDRLINLQNELGDTFTIAPLNGNIIPEEAIEMVDQGIIDYTVVDENVAIINRRYFPDIDTDLQLSIKQQIAFGIRKDSPLLRKKFNSWLSEFSKTTRFRYIKHKYYGLSSYTTKSKSEYSSIKGGKISPYDDVIKKASAKHNWDWRLVASIMYQESKFNINAQSWAGAYGLMQFMPATGANYGVYPDSPPEVQIDGGIRKLKFNYNQWEEIPDSIQRIKFTLATYNSGLGHILDAQRLAEKYGHDPLVWDDNVEIYIKKLSEPKYYQDPLSYYGYIRGRETYYYVREVYARFLEYETVFQEDV